MNSPNARLSPLQNRVLATGEVVANPARGTFMGNRGILHDDNKTLGRARWRHKAWIICVLKWKDWHRAVMTPNAYTELFFWDEAVALAAGHRPCALCRRSAYNAYRDAADLSGSAPEMDAKLHEERAIPRRYIQRRHTGALAALPNGSIIFDGVPKLIFEDAVYPVSAGGYGPPEVKGSGQVDVLTPPTTLRALSAGYVPEIAWGNVGKTI